MIEKSPTLGSIETSDYEKKQLAFQSIDYNLKNNLFKDLFPDITSKMQEELVQRKEAQLTAQASQSQRKVSSDQTNIQSCFWNFILIVGFAAFAYSVKYVMISSDKQWIFLISLWKRGEMDGFVDHSYH